MLTRPDGRLQLSSAVSTRFRSVEKMRNMLQKKRETLGSVHVLVYQLKTVGDLLFHRDATLLIGLQLESREAGDKTISYKSYISHSQGTMTFFGLVSP